MQDSRSVGALAGLAFATVFIWRILRSPNESRRRQPKRQTPTSINPDVGHELVSASSSGVNNRSEDSRVQNVVNEFFHPSKLTFSQIVQQRLSEGRKVTCRMLDIILEESSPEELQKQATVRPSVLEVLLEITKLSDFYLMERVLDDESEKKVLSALEVAGVFTSGGLVKDKVLFCSTENGRTSFVRQLEPDWHIDSNPEIVTQLSRFIKYQVHISPIKLERPPPMSSPLVAWNISLDVSSSQDLPLLTFRNQEDIARIMKVTVVTERFEFPVDVDSKEPILEIKKRIHHIVGVPVDCQNLSVYGCELIDGLDLTDYPAITDGMRLLLVIIQEPPRVIHYQPIKFKIIVRFLSRRIDLEVNYSETVGSLKEKIHIMDGKPIGRMNLVLLDDVVVELEDDWKSLHEYGVREMSEICVFMKGIGFLVSCDAAAPRVCVVLQTSSSVLNGTSISLEMKETTRVDEMREIVVERRMLPADDYIFVHKQRIMREDCSLRWHGVKNGDIVYVFKGSVSRHP